MNPQEIGEIKRRLNPDKRWPTAVRGIYLDPRGRIMSRYALSVGQLAQEENEKYMSLFRRVLSGSQGQQLLTVNYEQEQMTDDSLWQMWTRLADSGLTDEDAVTVLEEQAVKAITAMQEGHAESADQNAKASSWLVLLLHDCYPIPHRNKNHEIDMERSDRIMNYVLCCICPVKQGKSSLGFDGETGEFRMLPADWTVSAPDYGFMFPAYENGGANINRGMLYNRKVNELPEAVTANLLDAHLEMTAEEQKDCFRAVLADSLKDECTLDLVQNVQDTILEMIENQKADKTAEPLSIGGREMKRVLEDCGVSEDRAATFEQEYKEVFGEKAEVPAVNMVSGKKFTVQMPDVSIQVSPERSDLVETRIIDGRRYILVLADGDVEVNGVRIN